MLWLNLKSGQAVQLGEFGAIAVHRRGSSFRVGIALASQHPVHVIADGRIPERFQRRDPPPAPEAPPTLIRVRSMPGATGRTLSEIACRVLGPNGALELARRLA